jgi:hypothetical protein
MQTASPDRLIRLSENLRKHQEARALTASKVWPELWNDLEQELLERLLQCGPTDDDKRFRLQTAISVGRSFKRLLEAKGVTPGYLEGEIAVLEGQRPASVA